jgi:ATP-binding cassette subfamily F protein 3
MTSVETKEQKDLKNIFSSELDRPTVDTINWEKKDEIITLWPRHEQEKIAQARAKNVSKTVDLIINLKRPMGSDYLLKDANLLLEPNKRTALIGEPSCGKTTLLAALASGQIKDFPKHLHVHHCEEIHTTPVDIAVLDFVVKSHEFRNILLECEEQLKKRMAAEPKPSDEAMAALKSNLEYVQFNLNKIASDRAVERASKMLRVLGFDDVGQKRSTNSLSGGLRMRVALCAAFFIEADLLLLDEPTNHLDFPSVLWLENRLRGYRGSFLLISHDRDILENVCTSLIHFDSHKLTNYNVGFAEFEKQKAAAEKKKDAEIDKFMNLNRNVDPSSPKAREKAEKQAWQARYQARQLLLQGKFTFPTMSALPKNEGDPEDPKEISILKLTDVRFSYDEKKGLPFIFDTPVNYNVKASTRMGIMGPNGAGKSTLLKLLTKRLTPTQGTLTQHPTATIAYFAQHHAAELDLETTPAEYMGAQFPEVKNGGLLRKHLEKVGIAGPLADTRMKALSGGQRSCVIFAKITYVCPHLLIMDEPTNFLDLESVDSLISATNKFPGALLLVSHNRGMLKKCANQYLSVTPGQFSIFDDMKSCERATYSFIAELEEAGGAGKIGASALAKQKGHINVQSKDGENVKAEEKKDEKVSSTISISAAARKAPAKAPAKKVEEVPAKKGAPAKNAGRGAPAKNAGRGGAAPKRGGRGH